MYPISAGIADTLSARSQCHLVELESRSISECAKSHLKVASAQSISSVATVMMAGPAVVMAASAAPSVVMSASTMMAHVAVTMTVTALDLDDVIAGKNARRNSRHRQRRRRRGEDCCGDEARLNKTFHFWNLLHRALRRWTQVSRPTFCSITKQAPRTFLPIEFHGWNLSRRARFSEASEPNHRFRHGGDLK
jgi:hypothetical protein